MGTTPPSDSNRVDIFDTTLQRRRAVAGHLAEHAGEGRDRAAARAPWRGRDRGRLPDHLAGRLRGCRGDRPRGPGPRDLRALPHPQGRHRRCVERDQGLRPAADPHVHLDLGHPHRASAPDDPRGRQGPGASGRRAREVLLRRRGVLADGRDPRRHRFHGRGVRDRRRRRRDRHQHPRHRRLHDARGVHGLPQAPLRAGSRARPT